jgi:hypothetical protein
MVTHDIITLPSILLTKTYYVLCEETTYTYDKDDNNTNDELSEKGKRKCFAFLFYLKKVIDIDDLNLYI